MKVTIAQLNPVVGDIDGNLKKAKDVLSNAGGTDLVVFPEMFLTGYPPRDLLEKKYFIERSMKAVEKLAKASENYDFGIIVGVPEKNGGKEGMGLYNTAVLLHKGKKKIVQRKSLLPTYDVFDEARYFDPADKIDVVGFGDEKIGISICEDAWNDPQLWHRRHYDFNPIEELAKKGATLMINISASPFHLGKGRIRYRLVSNHSKKHGVPFIYVNQVGANDELIFDGRSIFTDSDGKLVTSLPPFKETVVTVDTKEKGKSEYIEEGEMESLESALVLGVGDYFRKCGFREAVVGLSGGIDSAVTCALAVKALGKENVLGISMPSRFSSTGSVDDSERLAKNLGIEFKVIPIKEVHDSYIATLKEHFKGKKEDVTEENIQARIRGNLLMAFSNKFGHLVLSTGNKSEVSVGYCTLYGDMTGGLSVISDVPKTMVYELARYINRNKEIIPKETIEKPPSAELRPNQKDQDSLPPYDILDEILKYYVDERLSSDEIKSKGFNKDTVDWVIRTVNRNEYKRKQAAPGLKVTSKAFGQGRRIPIAAKHE
ncbi:MAG: NAD+ synthase [Candidatus Aenigmarchaeota archaeon]|nr:NAD+ synthase [Candidatus Aenigmarchaeota archaeon]